MLTALVIIFIIAWVASATLPAYVADQRGRDGTQWFFIGLLFGPLISILALIALPPVAVEPEYDREADDLEEAKTRELAERLAQRRRS